MGEPSPPAPLPEGEGRWQTDIVDFGGQDGHKGSPYDGCGNIGPLVKVMVLWWRWVIQFGKGVVENVFFRWEDVLFGVI